MRRGSLIVRVLWAACLSVGGLNHARILLQHGLFHDYGGVASASVVYWSCLTILDPVVAALLFVRPKAGIVAAIMLIVTNVIHNLFSREGFAHPGELVTRAVSNPFVISQIGFIMFVLATARIAWRGVDGGRRPRLVRTS